MVVAGCDEDRQRGSPVGLHELEGFAALGRVREQRQRDFRALMHRLQAPSPERVHLHAPLRHVDRDAGLIRGLDLDVDDSARKGLRFGVAALGRE